MITQIKKIDYTDEKKLRILKGILKQLGSAVVAFSGGVDSSFLLKVASQIFPKDKLLAVTACSETYSESERKEAIKIAKHLGVRHRLIYTNEFSNDNFKNNPPDRCYYCKKELFSKLNVIADTEKLAYVIDGTNLDDLKDYRPGRKAAEELRVRHPLQEAGLTKEEIRRLSKRLNLLTYNKPALSCLASRFPYGETISKKGLKMVDEAESELKKFGFKDVRVRSHKTIARIELGNNELDLLLKNGFRKKIVKRLKDLGFVYITLDLEGYRTGSMNEILTADDRRLLNLNIKNQISK